MGDVRRRDVLAYFGAGALATAVAPRLGRAAPGPGPAGETTESAGAAGEAPWWLIAPHAADSSLGTARIQQVNMHPEAMVVEMTSEGGRFRAELCRRDDEVGAPDPIARTRRYDLFLVNGGNGRTRTDEQAGRAVLALAEAVERNEMSREALPLWTMRERWGRTASR